MSSPILQLEDVTISTPGGETLFVGLTHHFSDGVTALIGPNGSGKSTLLRSIATIWPVVKGTIRVGELDSRAQRARYLEQISFLPQTFSAYADLTGREFLEYSLRLRGANRKSAKAVASAWLQQVNLESAADARTGVYSQGMLQRLGLAYALQTDAQAYLLDEPFAGVDPESCQILLDTLFVLGERRLVLVSTHDLDPIVRRGGRVMRVHQKILEYVDREPSYP